MQDYISGIQQIGIGVKDASSCLHRYAKYFGMDTLVFNDVSEAYLMTCYTGGTVYKRKALFSLNMQGGGGFEIWQFTNREAIQPAKPAKYGDLGIYAPKLKCADVNKAYEGFKRTKDLQLSTLKTDVKGNSYFWVKDRDENVFNVVSGNHWFQQNGKPTGGISGAVIGVSDMDKSLQFYKTLLNIDKPVYDEIDFFENCFDVGKHRFRKVLLQKQLCGKGAFEKLLGPFEIELVQCLDQEPARIFENRLWGDCGFIHLCFDVFDMRGLKKHAEQNGYAFTVDSIDSFEMENASGRFCYMEDPDGTLIELVETHKIPIYKRWGLYLNLKKWGLEKPLPHWMIRLLALSKVK